MSGKIAVGLSGAGWVFDFPKYTDPENPENHENSIAARTASRGEKVPD